MTTPLPFDPRAEAALRRCTVGVIGYGNQGRAHALNLRDTGICVLVAQRSGSPRWTLARDEGFTPMATTDVVAQADLIILALPDESAAAVYRDDVVPALRPGRALGFLHGFNITYGCIEPPPDVDVILVAPKGPGTLLRDLFVEGRGLPAFIAVHQNASGRARELAIGWAQAIGAHHAGIYETTFREETEADLFGEQAVICGGLTALLQAGFETLVNAGYDPALAYFECVHECKQIADLIYAHGIAGMRQRISRTARYGEVTRGPRVIDARVREVMRTLLDEVRSGQFAREWLDEAARGCPRLAEADRQTADSLLEQTGASLRAHIRSGTDTNPPGDAPPRPLRP